MSLHPWMYRFSFPGFAETEWVLPEGVAHDEPWYEPLPASMACQDLLGWSLDPQLEDRLRELHESTFGAPLHHPAGVPFHTLMAPLRAAFERGELVAWVIRVSSVTEPAQLPRVEPKPRPEEKRKTWVEIVLLDDRRAPVAGERYALTMPGGEPRSGVLDGDGFARVDGIEPGDVGISFPEIDGREWGPTESDPAGPTSSYKVRQGDYVALVAHRHRFRSYRTIYDHPANEALRTKRQSPDILFPGDELHVPVFEARWEHRTTEKRHTFKTRERTLVRLRLVLKDRALQPLGGKRYTLEAGAHRVTEDEGKRTGSDGLVECHLHPSVTLATLRVLHDNGSEDLSWRLTIGALDPLSETTGVQARLSNLGFVCARTGSVDEPTVRALQAFRQAIGMEAPLAQPGEIDAPTRARLGVEHGC